jgi:hypothetical protein
MTSFRPILTALLLASAVFMTTAAPAANSPPTLKPGEKAKTCYLYDGKLGYGTTDLTVVSPNLFTDGLNDGGKVQFDDKENKIIISTGQDSDDWTLFSISLNVPGTAGSATAPAYGPPYVFQVEKDDYCELVLPQKPTVGSIMTVSKIPTPKADDPGSSDKGCQDWVGVQDTTTIKPMTVVGDLFPNAYTDGKADGTRVVYDKENQDIIIVTGKDSLPESLVTISIKAPSSSSNKTDGTYVYRLLANAYCNKKLKVKPTEGSIISVQTGPVPLIPRVNGGTCTTYMGHDDAAAVILPGSKNLVFEDPNLKNDGTVVQYDQATKNVKISTGKKAKDTVMVQITTTTVFSVEMNGGGTRTAIDSFRIRNQDSCTYNLQYNGFGSSESYSISVGTPSLY